MTEVLKQRKRNQAALRRHYVSFVYDMLNHIRVAEEFHAIDLLNDAQLETVKTDPTKSNGPAKGGFIWDIVLSQLCDTNLLLAKEILKETGNHELANLIKIGNDGENHFHKQLSIED